MSALKAERWAEPVYLDASALVKLFVPEPESDDLNQALAGLTDVIVSDLALTEMASALGRRTREQRGIVQPEPADAEEAGEVLDLSEADEFAELESDYPGEHEPDQSSPASRIMPSSIALPNRENACE